MKIMYTRPEDGGVSIVIAAPKADIEKVLGPLSQEEYEAHIWEKSIPDGVLNPRLVAEGGIPESREFRNAWVDVTPEAKVDIDLRKAKEIKLSELRAARNAELEKLDKETIIALEKSGDIEAIKARKQKLRDATEPLKNLQVSGINDKAILDQIKALSVLEV